VDDLDLSDPPTSESETDEPDESQKRRLLDNLVAPIDPSEYGKMTVLPETEALPRAQQLTPVTLETETRTMPSGEQRKIRRPILARDKFDGVDSDDESSDEDDGQTDTIRALHALKEQDMVQDEDEDALPQVVGGVLHDVDVDMLQEEADFIKFSRDALGISETQWDSIVSERRGRGGSGLYPRSLSFLTGRALIAFVPASARDDTNETEAVTTDPVEFPAAKKSAFKGKGVRFFDAISQDVETSERPQAASKATATARNSENPDRPRNPNLDSFEAVMEAMEAELEKTRSSRRGQPQISTSSAKAAHSGPRGNWKPAPFIDPGDVASDADDIDEAMDEELRRSLRVAESGDEESDDDPESRSRDMQEAGMDYNLIKNFLKSFNAQEGLSGPVSNLAGRLQPDWKLPRDNPDA
jgi:hypothetical protein